jgi:hypothetical protein
MRNIIVLLIIILSLPSFCQEVPTIKLKKEKEMVFFQKGEKLDTISLNKGDLFYLLFSRRHISLFTMTIDNGSLVNTANDSVYRLSYLPGLKYEMAYSTGDTAKLRPVIDGATALSREKIHVKIIDRTDGRVMLSNLFYYKVKE